MFLRTSRGVKCGAYCEVCWSGPTSFAKLPRMPVEDLCRRFRVSLVCDVCTQTVRRRASALLFSHAVEIFVPHASRASLVLKFLFMKKRTHIRRESFSSYVGPLLCLQHVSKGEPPKARRKKSTGIPVYTSSVPGVRRRAVRAGRVLFVRPSSHPLPGQAPGYRPAIRKRDGAVSEKPQEAGRADASRSLYCCGGM